MTKNKQQEDILEETGKQLGNTIHQFEDFFEEHKNKILTTLVVVLVAILGFVGYKKFIQGPKENDAITSMYKAQYYFEQDSFKIALNGDGANIGFQTIVDNYGSTKAGNLAQYYIGVCQYKLGKYQESITALEDFKCADPLLLGRKFEIIADANMELNKVDVGIENYKKSAENVKGNELLEPMVLSKLAIAAYVNKKPEIAKEAFEQLKNNYPNTPEGNDAVKYLIILENS